MSPMAAHIIGNMVGPPLARFYVVPAGDVYGEKARGPLTKSQARIAQKAEPSVKVVTRKELDEMRKRKAITLALGGKLQGEL